MVSFSESIFEYIGWQSLLPAPSAPLPPPTPAAHTYQLPAPISLHDCLKEHTTEEVLDEGNELYCSSCKAHKPVTKVIHFHKVRLHTFDYHVPGQS